MLRKQGMKQKGYAPEVVLGVIDADGEDWAVSGYDPPGAEQGIVFGSFDVHFQKGYRALNVQVVVERIALDVNPGVLFIVHSGACAAVRGEADNSADSAHCPVDEVGFCLESPGEVWR